MSEPTAHIRDHQSLIELNNTLEYSADSILKILEQVDRYLAGVIEALKKQMDVLEEELRVAEEELSESEQALSDCEASQEWDEEEEEYRPSCSCEAGRVSSAREIRDKCQERVNQAQSIIGDCEYEIEEYKKSGGFITPPGGEKLLEGLAHDHTDRATSKMREILDIVEKYLRYNMSVKSPFNSSIPPAADSMSSIDNTLTPEQKKDRFNDAVQRVIQQQQSDNCGSRQIADATRVMRCPGCGRPPVACICNNTREREYTRENIQIIRNDFSR